MAEFEITRMVLGTSHRITIDEADFNSIKDSRDVLNEVSSFEEKFLAVAEQYYELEKFVLSTSLSNMIFNIEDAASFYEVGSTFGRMAGAFLSMARLYNDTAKSHLSELSKGGIDSSAIQIIATEQYDTVFDYRFVEAVRNHAQHRAFPVHRSSFNSAWDADRTFLSHTTRFYFDYKKVLGDTKFKRAILTEVEDLGGSVELNSAIRGYFASLCDIHAAYRKLVEPFSRSAQDMLNHWRGVWLSQSTDPTLLAVAASHFNGGIITKKHPVVYIDPQLDEYRNYMEARTALLTNMGSRRVTF